MKSQLPELSALLDGELEPHELSPIMQAVVREPELSEAWQTYALIGDQLRQEMYVAPDLTPGVMAKIHDEPIVLAPRQLQLQERAERRRPFLALAAAVAGVAVVGWLALAGNLRSMPAEGKLAAVPPAPTFSLASTNLRGMQPTLVAANPGWSRMSEPRRDYQDAGSRGVALYGGAGRCDCPRGGDHESALAASDRQGGE
jgi:negative regulator of sigma E activity